MGYSLPGTVVGSDGPATANTQEVSLFRLRKRLQGEGGGQEPHRRMREGGKLVGNRKLGTGALFFKSRRDAVIAHAGFGLKSGNTVF